MTCRKKFPARHYQGGRITSTHLIAKGSGGNLFSIRGKLKSEQEQIDILPNFPRHIIIESLTLNFYFQPAKKRKTNVHEESRIIYF